MKARVKICGVTNVADALACVDLGVDAIGLNFVAKSPRRIDEEMGKQISAAVGSRALVVGVVANMSVQDMRSLALVVGLGCLQLHGDEPPSFLLPLLPHAYKALRIADASDVVRADLYGGEYLLVDAKSPAALGGTGESFDWALVTELARTRKLALAGGLGPANVADAIRAVSPYCVDAASGVETPGNPRKKDTARLEAFVAAVRRG